MKFILAAGDIIAQHLAVIFTASQQLGKYPETFKIARVVPVFKQGTHSDPNNYRPISLLSTFSIIFERLIFNRITDFLEDEKILSNSQFGFRKRHSTTHALIDFTTAILRPHNQCGHYSFKLAKRTHSSNGESIAKTRVLHKHVKSSSTN